MRRYVYAVGYLLMAAAGGVTAVYSSPSITRATAGVQVLLIVWEAFLVIGGLASGIGALMDSWLGEFLGLPLLASVFAIYAVSIGFSSPNPANGIVVSVTLGGVSAVILGRWLEINALRRTAEEVTHG